MNDSQLAVPSTAVIDTLNGRDTLPSTTTVSVSDP